MSIVRGISSFLQPIKPGQLKVNIDIRPAGDAQNRPSPSVDKRPSEGAEGCNCLRDMMRIFCESCGHVDEGMQELFEMCPMKSICIDFELI